jgi:anti-anti-sigma factor
VPLPGGSVALAVGEVAGHGLEASVAATSLRSVIDDLLIGGADIGTVGMRAEALAARTPALRACVINLAVLDPASGKVSYLSCGQPPPMVIGADGTCRFLTGAASGPLGTGSAQAVGTAALSLGDALVMYSDGLVNQPDRTVTEGMAALSKAASDAVAARRPGDDQAARPDQWCGLLMEWLGESGWTDEVTILAALLRTDPLPALTLSLPADPSAITAARRAVRGWLATVGLPDQDSGDLQLAVAEVVANAVEHAGVEQDRGSIEITAAVQDDGALQCGIADQGAWREPDLDASGRGHGLMVAAAVVDQLQVIRGMAGGSPDQEGNDAAAAAGTLVTLRRQIGLPAVVTQADLSLVPAGARPATHFRHDTGQGGPVVRVAGQVDDDAAATLGRELAAAARGGVLSLTADLTNVTYLGIAGVRALAVTGERLAANGQTLTLVAPHGSIAADVLDMVRLPRAATAAAAS